MNIGDTVYFFDGNRRKYRLNASGRSFGAPIYSEHFRPEKITSETSRSWVTEFGNKIPKNDPSSKCYTYAAMQDAIWINDHRRQIVRRIEFSRDASLLREIANLIGYEGDK